MKLAIYVVAVIGLGLSRTTPADAAAQSGQGRMGPQSRAAIRIMVSVAPRFQIIGLSKTGSIRIGSGPGHGQALSVASNASGARYSVTATNLHLADRFALTSASGAELAYSVEWAAGPGRERATLLAPGIPLAGLVTSAMRQAPEGPAASSLIVRVGDRPLQPNAVASYAGTLLLVIAPE